jgi:hypothetical protein
MNPQRGAVGCEPPAPALVDSPLLSLSQLKSANVRHKRCEDTMSRPYRIKNQDSCQLVSEFSKRTHLSGPFDRFYHHAVVLPAQSILPPIAQCTELPNILIQQLLLVAIR